MRILLFCLISVSGFSQTESISKALNLMTTYETEPKEDILNQVDILLESHFSNKENRNDPDALYAKVRFLTAELLSPNFEEVDSTHLFLDELVASYNRALKKDVTHKYRYEILKRLYSTKTRLLDLGRYHYETLNYNKAYPYYNAAVSLNQAQIDFPRVAKLDTTVVYTAALTAYASKDDEEAIKHFQKLVDVEYGRAEIYDYLVRLYDRNNFDVKAKKVAIKKKKLFPDLEQN